MIGVVCLLAALGIAAASWPMYERLIMRRLRRIELWQWTDLAEPKMKKTLRPAVVLGMAVLAWCATASRFDPFYLGGGLAVLAGSFVGSLRDPIFIAGIVICAALVRFNILWSLAIARCIAIVTALATADFRESAGLARYDPLSLLNRTALILTAGTLIGAAVFYVYRLLAPPP